MSTLQISDVRKRIRGLRRTDLGVDLAFHGPTFGVLPISSSRSVEAPTPTSGFRFKEGTIASSMQNRSSLVLARSGVRGIATLGLLGVPGEAGCCDGFRLTLGDGFGWAFGCERTMEAGMSCKASHSRFSFTDAARSTGSCKRENGDLAPWCPCTALASCLMCQGDKSSSTRTSTRVSILTDMY